MSFKGLFNQGVSVYLQVKNIGLKSADFRQRWNMFKKSKFFLNIFSIVSSFYVGFI